MSKELEDENYVIQIRAKLNERKIKLWEPPYYDPTTKSSIEPKLKALAEEFLPEVSITLDSCLITLKTLQSHALEKLESKAEFTKIGLATLKVRSPTQGAFNKHIDVKITISSTGLELTKLVASKMDIDPKRIKLVCRGKVLQPEPTLVEQKVANGSTLMALVMTESPEEVQKESNTFDRVQKIRKDAELLIQDNEQFDFLSLEDQDGNALHMPKSEKKSLLMALTLYEKGKAALRKENFEEALLLFLEADSDFRSCTSQLLTVVDNYALLNLDIVWCYLRLKNMNQLPDAEQRLRLCDEKFRQSYGENMRRVTAIKGTQQCSEKALLLRLHLLKAVLFFYQNKREDARIMFQVVETELQSLKVDDGCLTTLLNCGFEISEARIALRVCSNNVEAAIEFITNRRRLVQENEEKSKRTKALSRKLNLDKSTDEEFPINISLVDQLVEMGFEETLAALALKRSANDLVGALNELQSNQPDLRRELLERVIPCRDLVDKLLDLGFEMNRAEAALRQTINRFEEAVEYLVTGKDSFLAKGSDCALSASSSSSTSSPDKTSSDSSAIADINDQQPGPSSRKKIKNDSNAAKKEMMDILYKSFSKDINTDNNNYLDLPLIEEANILEEYKKLLDMP